MELSTNSLSNSVSKGSINEAMSMSRASMEEADRRLTPGGPADAISNERIRKGDELLEIYKVTSDAILGGMGSVWRVYHKNWDIDLAMKRPQPKFFAEGSKRRKEEFVSECENWINLGLHANIVSCYYVREIGGVPTIFSEWMDGGSLRDRIRDGSLYEGDQSLVQGRILDLAIQAARGLKYSHDKGLIHQDIKPGNLLLSSEWEAKVADFGLAQARSQLKGSTGYTIEYCPEEQIRGEKPAPWMDVYAWGLTVLEMYAGERFWKTGEEAREKWEEIFGSCRIPVPDEMRSLLSRCVGAAKGADPAKSGDPAKGADPAKSAGTIRGAEPGAKPAGAGFFSRLLNRKKVSGQENEKGSGQENTKDRRKDNRKSRIDIPDFPQIIPELERIYKETTGELYPRADTENVTDTADSLNNKALSFLDLGQEEAAEKLWEEALEKDSKHRAVLFNLNLHQLRAEKKYLYEIENQKTGSRVLDSDDFKELEQETGSVPRIQVKGIISPVPFISPFIHAATAGREIVFAYNNMDSGYGEETVGPFIVRAERETGKTLQTDGMPEIRALGTGIDRILICPGGSSAIVFLKDNTAALYDIGNRKLVRISGTIDFSIDSHYQYTFSRDGSLLVCHNYDDRDYVLQIPSMQVRRIRPDQEFVCRTKGGGLLFRQRGPRNRESLGNRDALYEMRGNGEYREVFTFEEKVDVWPVFQYDCDPDPFICFAYVGSDQAFVLGSDYRKTFVSKDFLRKLPKILFYDESSHLIYTLPYWDKSLYRDPYSHMDRLALWDLERQVRLCTMETLPDIDEYSNLETCFDPAERKVLLTKLNERNNYRFSCYPVILPAAPKDTVPASFRLSQIHTFSERREEQKILTEAKRAFDKCVGAGDHKSALEIFRSSREISGFSGSSDARAMEEKLNGVFRRSGLRTVLPAGTVAAPPECVLDGSHEVVPCGDGLLAVYASDKPEEGILISRPDGTVVRCINVPHKTIYTAVRKNRIFAFEKSLKCKVYDLEGNLTESYEKNPGDHESVVIMDVDADGKNLLYAGRKDSDFLTSEWITLRELVSGQERFFTQRMNGEPCRFLGDGTILFPEFVFVSEQYGEEGYEIKKITRYSTYEWNPIRTYPVYYDEGLTLFKNCRIGIDQSGSMFFPEMDYADLEDGGHGRVIFAYDPEETEDPLVNDIYCSRREEEQVIMLPGGRFFAGCSPSELWIKDFVEDSISPGFNMDITESRLVFRPDGLEFYLRDKEETGGTWKRYRVEYEYSDRGADFD